MKGVDRLVGESFRFNDNPAVVMKVSAGLLHLIYLDESTNRLSRQMLGLEDPRLRQEGDSEEALIVRTQVFQALFDERDAVSEALKKVPQLC